MLKQPNNLHPEVFVEVWKKWSVLCAKHELTTGGPLTKTTTERIWDASLKIVDYNIRLDWNSFCREHGIGVYK